MAKISLITELENFLVGVRLEYWFDDTDERFYFKDLIVPDYTFSLALHKVQIWDQRQIESYILEKIREYRPQSADTGRRDIMLEQLIKLYTAAQTLDVRSVIPHLVGPPGVGKSQVCEKLAEFAGVRLHVVNVSRISPLEIEGVQMPHGEGDEQRLRLLINSLWGNLQEGDIILFDEFLRGFPEVYNGLLDIITSREVAGIKLPKVFFVAASNSVATYDKALEDRLIHIFVPDLRSSVAARTKAKELLAREIGLLPAIVKSQEMDELFTTEVLPMYNMLDYFKGKASVGTSMAVTGHSVRNLVGQAHLREVQSAKLKDLIVLNNQMAMSQRKWQYVVLLSTRKVDPRYVSEARKLNGNPALTEIQARNLELNLAFIEAQEAMQEEDEPLTTEEDTDDPVV